MPGSDGPAALLAATSDHQLVPLGGTPQVLPGQLALAVDGFGEELAGRSRALVRSFPGKGLTDFPEKEELASPLVVPFLEEVPRWHSSPLRSKRWHLWVLEALERDARPLPSAKPLLAAIPAGHGKKAAETLSRLATWAATPS